ncbi:hypothetical protein ACQ4M3_39415 [Leptolyngbya sp. AN03gr2]|uniref:hypothetical protein n=1 Tax=unclassified Leptolyngbya TaxID=2650499 RepID=UPI003D31C515
MKTWIPVLLLVASVSLVGCDDRQSRERLNTTMNSWINRDINEFIRKYGPPTTTFTLPNGNTVYSYKTDREEVSKQPTYVNESRNRRGEKETVVTGGGTFVDRDFCEINVEFDRSSKIQAWRYEGDSPNNCKIKNLPKTLQKQLQKDGILR